MTFFEKRERKGWLFGTNVEQEWERWLIKLTIREITGEAGKRENIIIHSTLMLRIEKV